MRKGYMNLKEFKEYLLTLPQPTIFPCPYIRVLAEDVCVWEHIEQKYEKGSLICVKIVSNPPPHTIVLRCHFYLIIKESSLEALCSLDKTARFQLQSR